MKIFKLAESVNEIHEWDVIKIKRASIVEDQKRQIKI